MKPLPVAFALLLLVHGAIHTIGFVKGFGLAPVPALVHPIDKTLGAVWLAAGLLFVGAAGCVLVSPVHFRYVGLAAAVLSQAVILTSFRDAFLGTLPNLLTLAVVVVAFLGTSSSSLRAEYQREVARGLARTGPAPLVTEADLEPFPPAVRTYLRRAGCVGKPRVRNYRVRFAATMRFGRGKPWLSMRVEQHNFNDEPSRFFYAETEMFGLPVQVFHRYVGPSATMRARVASLVDVVDARGERMDQSETVTLLNDMLMFAPASLLGAHASFRERDPRHVEITFENAGHRVSAELEFDAAGDLVNFVSKDRYQSADGKTYRRFPWVTPVGDYRDFGGFRLPAHGDAIWQEPEGDFLYGRFDVLDIAVNLP